MLLRKIIFLLSFLRERPHKIPGLLQMAWRKWQLKKCSDALSKTRPPCRVIARLTNRCNLRCLQCGQWGHSGHHKHCKEKNSLFKEMTTEQWKKVIDQLSRKSFFCPHIHFFGGEPFLRKDIFELIRHASSRNMITGVNTNGTVLKGQAQKIITSGLDYIIISLDGPEKINNSIRLGPGNRYAQVISAVQELVAAKKENRTHFPIIEICFTLTQENQDHLLETAQIVKGLGVNVFLVQLGMFTTEDLGLRSSRIIEEHFACTPHYWEGFVSDKSGMRAETILQQISAVKQLLGDQYNQLPRFPVDPTEYFGTPQTVLRGKRCAVGWLTSHILPNGDVATCDDLPDIIAGNLVDTDFDLIWRGQTYRAFRQYIECKGTFPFCARCCSLYECDLY
jgi:MoaA/NifB/PqqE/SkfB family radical SAM enzyme